MAVGNITARCPRKNTRYFSGEFSVSGGAINAGSVKTKNEFTITRNGAGLFTMQLVENGVPYKYARISEWDSSVVGLTGAGNGGWTITINADSMVSGGNFQLQYLAQAFTAADPLANAIVKVSFTCEGEAA